MIKIPKLSKPFLTLIILFVFSTLLLAQNKFDQIIQLEAEDSFYQNVKLETDSTASGNEFIKIEKDGFIKWKFDLEKSGWYEINFRYRAFGGEKEQYLIRNGVQRAVGFGIAEEWNIFKKKLSLNAGDNTIELKPSWGFIDIDYLSINETEVVPTFKPKQNFFYKKAPANISIKLNRYGYKLESITCDDKSIPFSISDFPHNEDAVIVTIDKKELMDFENGSYDFLFSFDEEFAVGFKLNVLNSRKPAELTILAPDVEHGTAVIIILPTGKTMLIDCAKDWVRDEILIPFFKRHNISKIDYFFITHYHGDHDSGDKGEKIKQLYSVDNFYDYKSFYTGQEFEIDGVTIKILNSFEDGVEENTRSLSFKLEYNGFSYVHGGDIYAVNQQKILKRFPNDIETNVFYSNHHFHGSVDVEYLRAINPEIVLVQAQEAIYARSAYIVNFKKETVDYLKRNKKRFIEDLPALEVGTIVIRANSPNDWSYETYKDPNFIVPWLFKNKK